jgi:hypothetical protein
MSTATGTKITYRKTKQGEWVAFGPARDIAPGRTIHISKKGTRAVDTRRVEKVGKTFKVDGVECVYGYLAADRPARRARRFGAPATPAQARPRPRQCPTGGNCSSFGNGRSCGAHDCDGY